MKLVTWQTDGDRDAVISGALADLEAGKSISEIAESRGMPRTTLYEWMLSSGPEQYNALKERALIRRFVDAQESLESATTHVEIAKFDRVCKFAAWVLERRVRSFAPKQELSGPGGGSIPIQMDNFERARRYAYLKAMFERGMDAQGNVIDVAPEPAALPPEASNVVTSEIPGRRAAPLSKRRGVRNVRTANK